VKKSKAKYPECGAEDENMGKIKKRTRTRMREMRSWGNSVELIKGTYKYEDTLILNKEDNKLSTKDFKVAQGTSNVLLALLCFECA
jgi:uncharacterized protein (UPF0128 family)